MGFLDATGITRLVSDLKNKFALKAQVEAKQDALISGTNIKTLNSTTLLGSGDIEVQPTLVSGTNIKTVGGYSLLGSGNIPFPSENNSHLKSSCHMIASTTSGVNRIWLSSADGVLGVPINTSTTSTASETKTLNTTPINPFFPIVFSEQSANIGGLIPSSSLYNQFAFDIRYSYVKTLTAYNPVYLKCTPQTNSSVVMNDIVQTLPTAADGFVYVFLGNANTTTTLALSINHPIFYHDGTSVRLWTGESIS